MDRPSQRFDRRLFTLKLSELSHEMQTRSVSSDRKASAVARGGRGSLLMNMADGQLTLLQDWLEGVDRICREVWEIQRETVTAEFVRDVVLPEVMTLIEVRKGAAEANIGLVARRTQRTGLEVAQRHLTMETNRLKSSVRTKYEIEVRTLEHRKAARISKAPAPIKPLSGGRMIHSTPKQTQVPPTAPAYFPLDLWPEAAVILDEACEKYPNQTQALDLCKHVVSKMTPLFCKAVKTGKMNAYAVFHQGLGGMEDLLHSLLVYNCDHDNKRFRLAGEIRNSEECRESRKAIAAIADAEAKVSVADGMPNDHRKAVKAYIDEVLSKNGKRITKKDIWTKAGYKTRTEFERWERQDSKHPNHAAAESFSRILREKPHLK